MSLHDRQIYILCGSPASGKSYYINQIEMWESFLQFPHMPIVISSDKLRSVIGCDEGDQTVNHEVFTTIEYMVEYLMKFDKRGMIIDATNMTKRNRTRWIELAKENRYRIEAHVMRTPVDVCIARNAARDRKVPVDVIHKMMARFEEPTLDEGFDEIVNVNHHA